MATGEYRWMAAYLYKCHLSYLVNGKNLIHILTYSIRRFASLLCPYACLGTYLWLNCSLQLHWSIIWVCFFCLQFCLWIQSILMFFCGKNTTEKTRLFNAMQPILLHQPYTTLIDKIARILYAYKIRIDMKLLCFFFYFAHRQASIHIICCWFSVMRVHQSTRISINEWIIEKERKTHFMCNVLKS